jgi:hypothetical protein
VIYLEQSYDLEPAAPSTRDRLIEVMHETLLPANARHGARLVGAFFAHEEWFSRVIHLTEFDDFAAYQAYRKSAAADEEATRGAARLTELAPGQRVGFLEPLGPVAPERLQQAISASAEKPVGTYTFAILDVTPARLPQFTTMLAAAAPRLPIIAALRNVSGNPSRVTDLWAMDTGAPGYAPNDDQQEAFFGPLRQVAPREKMVRLHALPYSPLR